VLMLTEYASRPLRFWMAPTTAPETYADVVRDRGDSPTAVLFEFPTSALDDAAYMYYSTFHWQTLVNGYSGFSPPSYRQLAAAMETFPDEASIGAIKAHGTRYLVIHGERLDRHRYRRLVPQLDARPDLALVSRRPTVIGDKRGEISLYRVMLGSRN